MIEKQACPICKWPLGSTLCYEYHKQRHQKQPTTDKVDQQDTPEQRIAKILAANPETMRLSGLTPAEPSPSKDHVKYAKHRYDKIDERFATPSGEAKATVDELLAEAAEYRLQKDLIVRKGGKTPKGLPPGFQKRMREAMAAQPLPSEPKAISTYVENGFPQPEEPLPSSEATELEGKIEPWIADAVYKFVTDDSAEPNENAKYIDADKIWPMVEHLQDVFAHHTQQRAVEARIEQAKADYRKFRNYGFAEEYEDELAEAEEETIANLKKGTKQ